MGTRGTNLQCHHELSLHSECRKNGYSSSLAKPTASSDSLCAPAVSRRTNTPPWAELCRNRGHKDAPEALEWLCGLGTFSCNATRCHALCTALPMGTAGKPQPKPVGNQNPVTKLGVLPVLERLLWRCEGSGARVLGVIKGTDCLSSQKLVLICP